MFVYLFYLQYTATASVVISMCFPDATSNDTGINFLATSSTNHDLESLMILSHPS